MRYNSAFEPLRATGESVLDPYQVGVVREGNRLVVTTDRVEVVGMTMDPDNTIRMTVQAQPKTAMTCKTVVYATADTGCGSYLYEDDIYWWTKTWRRAYEVQYAATACTHWKAETGASAWYYKANQLSNLAHHFEVENEARMYNFEGVPNLNLMPPEVRAAYEEQERRVADARERQRTWQEQYTRARERSYRLLRRFLTPQQERDLDQHGWFLVHGSNGGLYRIERGAHGNVKKVDEWNTRILEALCVQPPSVPDGDAMLAQKILLEKNEGYVRDVANITVVADYRVIPGSRQNMLERLGAA